MKKNLYHILGQVLKNFFTMFGFPFLVLTSFMLYNAGTVGGKYKYFANESNLRSNIFSASVPYDKIFSPNLIINPSDEMESDSNSLTGNSLNFTTQSFAPNSTGVVKSFWKLHQDAYWKYDCWFNFSSIVGGIGPFLRV